MRKYLILLLTIIIINGCTIKDNMSHKDLDITTSDNIKLSADLYEAGEEGIVLLHMLSVTKKTWNEFALKLQEEGYSVIAIDLRGHGESDLDYKKFTEEDFNNMLLDVDAAKKALNMEKVAVIGASIGANLAIKKANDFDAAISLSPGLDYKGLKTKDDAEKIETPTLIVASGNDKYSFESSKELNELIGSSEIKLYSDKGHGTNMLDEETTKYLLDWLEENF